MTALKHILLVEDSERDAELALHALAENRLANEVVRVRDGAEALEYLRREGAYEHRRSGQPAVVMLDLKMPRMDGLEVLKEMKNDASLRVLPVVVMTSSREDADLARSYELGANAYVVKPVKFQEFVDAVRQVGSFWGLLNEPPPRNHHNGD